MILQTAAQLRDEGIGTGQLNRLVRGGELVRVRHGVYDRQSVDPKPREAHQRLIAATVPLLDDGAVLSHVSAGVLHGLPVPRSELDRVWTTRQSLGGGHFGTALHQLKAPFREEDVVEVDGWRVTSPSRTAVDLARALGLEYGIAAADAVLHAGVARELLDEQVGLWPRRPWMRRARTVVTLADGGAESYGESVSRLLMWQLGLPAPVVQPRFTIAGRTFRSDFGWPEFRVLGEFDGKTKYAELLRPAQSPVDVIMAEKRREQYLQSEAWYVVRWGTDDMRDREEFRRLLEAAFLHGRRYLA